MNNVDTERITAQLRHFTHEETIALLCDFWGDLDQKQQTRLLRMIEHGPRPLAAEAMGLGDPKDLLDDIRQLRDAIARDHYVEYGAGYDPEYRDYRGFGDDSWIDEMDDLFEAATSFFRAGKWKTAVKAYLALFDIFELNQDGYHFTRPRPTEALHADLDEIKRNLFIAIGRGYPDPASKVIETSDKLRYYGSDHHALLEAWQERVELMTALETALITLARHAMDQRSEGFLPHASELLREFYRRYRSLPDYESLCRKVGHRQGWPYEDLVTRYSEQQDWEKALTWADDGLTKLPAKSYYRPMLREARGQALLRLNRPREAFEALQALFHEHMTVSVYLLLREAAQAVGRWEKLYSQVVIDMHERVGMVDWEVEYSDEDVKAAELIGFAHLLEGDWQAAVEWALNAEVPTGWCDVNLLTIVSTGLLRMGLAVRTKKKTEKQLDETLTQALNNAPEIVRKHGDLLESAAHGLPARSLLDSAVKLYEHMVELAIGGKDRDHYAQAGAHCQVIRAIRRWQGREAAFDRYYQGLLVTHSRRPALKDELRRAIEAGRRA